MWLAGVVPREERKRKLHTVRKVPEAKAYKIKKTNMRVGIERSPRRRALPRAQSQFLALTKQNGAPKNLFDCIWEGEGDLGVSIFLKEMTATGGLGRLVAAKYTVENERFAGEEWPFYPEAKGCTF